MRITGALDSRQSFEPPKLYFKTSGKSGNEPRISWLRLFCRDLRVNFEIL